MPSKLFLSLSLTLTFNVNYEVNLDSMKHQLHKTFPQSSARHVANINGFLSYFGDMHTNLVT